MDHSHDSTFFCISDVALHRSRQSLLRKQLKKQSGWRNLILFKLPKDGAKCLWMSLNFGRRLRGEAADYSDLLAVRVVLLTTDFIKRWLSRPLLKITTADIIPSDKSLLVVVGRPKAASSLPAVNSRRIQRFSRRPINPSGRTMGHSDYDPACRERRTASSPSQATSPP